MLTRSRARSGLQGKPTSLRDYGEIGVTRKLKRWHLHRCLIIENMISSLEYFILINNQTPLLRFALRDLKLSEGPEDFKHDPNHR